MEEAILGLMDRLQQLFGKPIQAYGTPPLKVFRRLERTWTSSQQEYRGLTTAALLQCFCANPGKRSKALIIDQRFNGGGGIDQELLQVRNQRKAYQTYRGRDSIQMPRPVQAFFGPMVVVQNKRSASDAEMFPDGFRTLGLGKVVGVQTYGAVIGTGSYRLLDGATIRTPGAGVFTAKGQNMENYGVPPDVPVDNTPEDFLAGRDRQIEKAVEVLRGQIK